MKQMLSLAICSLLLVHASHLQANEHILFKPAYAEHTGGDLYWKVESVKDGVEQEITRLTTPILYDYTATKLVVVGSNYPRHSDYDNPAFNWKSTLIVIDLQSLQVTKRLPLPMPAFRFSSSHFLYYVVVSSDEKNAFVIGAIRAGDEGNRDPVKFSVLQVSLSTGEIKSTPFEMHFGFPLLHSDGAGNLFIEEFGGGKLHEFNPRNGWLKTIFDSHSARLPVSSEYSWMAMKINPNPGCEFVSVPGAGWRQVDSTRSEIRELDVASGLNKQPSKIEVTGEPVYPEVCSVSEGEAIVFGVAKTSEFTHLRNLNSRGWGNVAFNFFDCYPRGLVVIDSKNFNVLRTLSLPDVTEYSTVSTDRKSVTFVYCSPQARIMDYNIQEDKWRESSFSTDGKPEPLIDESLYLAIQLR